MARMKDIYTEYYTVFEVLEAMVNEDDCDKRRVLADVIHNEICAATMAVITNRENE